MIFGLFLKQKKKHNEIIIKHKIIRDTRTLFEQAGKDYYEPKRISNFWNYNNIEYESNSDKNRDLSFDEYLNKIQPQFRNIIISFQKSDAWKTQLTIASNFISSKDSEEQCLTHSSSGNIKFTACNDANYVIAKLFKSLCSRYQENLQTSMKGSDFIFDSVQLLY